MPQVNGLTIDAIRVFILDSVIYMSFARTYNLFYIFVSLLSLSAMTGPKLRRRPLLFTSLPAGILLIILPLGTQIFIFEVIK
jgi:hypothetical protein